MDEQPDDRVGFAARLSRRPLAGIARLAFRATVTGREHVPRDGPVILASNHISFIDSPLITLFSPRPVRFLAKSDYFDGSGARGWASRSFFTAVGAVPVQRGAGQAAQQALDAGRAILERGEAFAMHPEGTRSRDGRLYRGRTGVAWLALMTGAPVVPIGLAGTDDAMPIGTRRPRLAHVECRFGEPLDLSSFGAATSGRARRLATDAVMDAIAALSGQELAGEHNEPLPQTLGERMRRALPHERR